jgi:hypothetical protein
MKMKGILILIPVVDLRMDGLERISFLCSVRLKQSTVGPMATGLRELKLALWVTKLRSDSSDSI